jgi:hypothetical protein
VQLARDAMPFLLAHFDQPGAEIAWIRRWR